MEAHVYFQGCCAWETFKTAYAWRERHAAVRDDKHSEVRYQYRIEVTCNPRATMSASTAFASQTSATSLVKIDALMLNELTNNDGLEDPACLSLVLPSLWLPS